MSPLAPPGRTAQLALLVWLGTAVTLALEDHAPFRQVASFIAPVRRGLGISQSWSMFAPNPSRATYWLEVQGRIGSRWRKLPQPGTAPLHSDWMPRYPRVGKFTRGLVSSSARRDRRHLARWWCAERPDLVSVRFVHARLPSSPPGIAPATGPIRQTPIEVVACR